MVCIYVYTHHFANLEQVSCAVILQLPCKVCDRTYSQEKKREKERKKDGDYNMFFLMKE